MKRNTKCLYFGKTGLQIHIKNESPFQPMEKKDWKWHSKGFLFFFALCAKLHIVLFVFFIRERFCPPSLINHCETCAVTSNRNTICQDIRPLKAPLTAFTTITSRELETLCPSKSQGHHPFYPLCCWVLWLKTRPLSTVNFREPTADFLFTEL